MRLLARISALMLIGLCPVRASPPTVAPTVVTARYDVRDEIFSPVVARQAMVASDHGLATQAGIAIMQQGGNAIDAAVAVGFALAVVQPYAGNLGGGGFMLIRHDDSGDEIALDFRETAPMQAHRDMYLDAQHQIESGKSLYSHHAIGVPGTVAGLTTALRAYGTLPLETVVAPAIALARDGFPVSATLAAALNDNRETLSRWSATRAIFFKAAGDAHVCEAAPCTPDSDGVPLTEGDWLIQADLAATLTTIASEGAEGFYTGPIAARIAAEIAAQGGPLTIADLARYRAVFRQPVSGHYRGLRVSAMPPPSSGGVHIVQMLNVLERYPLGEYGAGSAQALHLMAEAMKLAYADRSQWLGDPDFVDVPTRGLTSRAYADALATRIDLRHAAPSASLSPGNPLPYESPETTHYSVVDARGNVVSVTYTLNMNFGSGIVAAGTGVLLNNEMDDFSAKPGAANAFGLTGGAANAIAPRKRPLSSMSPVIVYRDDKPWLVSGSPGGARIISTVLQAIVNAVDFGMNPAESAAMPRIHHQWLPDVLRVEKGFSPDTLRLLAQMGHQVRVSPVMGRTQTIQIEPDRLLGASDPRHPDGYTAGY